MGSASKAAGQVHREVAMSKHAIVASFLLGSLTLAATAVAQTADPVVTPDRTIALWNGKDLSNWVADVPKRDADPSLPASFVLRGGMLVSLGKPEGHLVTEQADRDYRLVAEYRFPGAGGNCGILIHASTPRAPTSRRSPAATVSGY
jgi:hypothetical protein